MTEKRKILVVDDSVIQLKFLEKVLEKWDYISLSAKSAEEAMDLLEKNPDVSFVITDIKMPSMDGFDFVERIKSIHKYTGRVFACSANNTPEHLARAREVGITAFVTKPLKVDELKGLLDQFSAL